MNIGEKNELLLKIYLTYLRDNNPKLKTCFGPIKSVGFGEKEYKSCPKDIDFDSLENNSDNKKKVEEKIEEINKSLNIEKSSPQNKADIYINKIAYSIKYMDAGKPSIVNHTTRKGFLRIAKQLKLNIRDLGSGFALSNAEAEAVHFKKPSSVNFALTSASLILL